MQHDECSNILSLTCEKHWGGEHWGGEHVGGGHCGGEHCLIWFSGLLFIVD